ncbi:MAG: alpha/beta fold hydrolase [Vicinamibacterales bacterium]
MDKPHGQIGRRGFLQGLAISGLAIPAWAAAMRTVLAAQGAATPAATAAAAGLPPLDLAEWTNGYIGMEATMLPRGETLTGKHIYVEIWTPRQLRHPYPVILVPGGTSQGLDWMVTPDGRRGWALMLAEQGYRVYVVDRPGQGRNPFIPDIHGPFSAQAPTLERAVETVSVPDAAGHTQWPGSGRVDDAALAQFLASQGPAPQNAVGAESAWRFSGAQLLDETGPAIFITHGDGATFAWVSADERPALVKAVVAIEPPAPAVPGGRGGGPAVRTPRIAATPIAFDTFRSTAVALVSGGASPGADRTAQTAAFLQQAGLTVDTLSLAALGVAGNGPYPMLERNAREALAPVMAWLDRRTSAGAPAVVQPPVRANSDSTALRLADHNYFFVGIEKRQTLDGTVVHAQTGVQVFTPLEVRHPHPIILVHGGLGQAVHLMGIGRRPGWVHYFVRNGYQTYVMDRPAYGRVPLHPGAYGDYFTGYGGGTNLANILRNSPLAPGTPRNTGLVGEELGLQFVANESGFPRSMALHSEQWARGAVELLDRIGPAVILTHAYGGCLGWIAADRRPNLVKALVTVESNNAPFEGDVTWGVTAVPLTFDPPLSDPREFRLTEWTPPPGSPGPNRPHRIQAAPARQLTNLAGIPILWMQGENNYSGPAQVQFLKQSGCDAEFMRLRDHGIEEGNTNLMVLERNNFEVFELIREWLDRRTLA